MLFLHVPQYDVSNRSAIVKLHNSQSPTKVEANDLICQFETAKAVYEFFAPQSGFFVPLIKNGEQVALGAKLGFLADNARELEEYLKSDSTLDKPTASEDDAILGTRFSRLMTPVELSMAKNVQLTWTESVPLWVQCELDVEDVLKEFKTNAKNYQASGTLNELILWSSLELYRKFSWLGNFVKLKSLCTWQKKSVVMVTKSLNGTLILPTFDVSEAKQSMAELAEKIYEVKKNIVIENFKGIDFTGGGLLLSVLEHTWLKAFNALPPPQMSFSLAVSGPYSLHGNRHISIVLGYDHRLIDGHDASELINEFRLLIETRAWTL